MFKPLAGIRVLDLTHVLAGPYGTHVLTQLGAETTKVERPGVGDVMRNGRPGVSPPGMAAQFVGLNHGKRSLALDMKSAAGREILTRLARRADVLVENLRPGELDKIGFDFASVATLNPRLIYCSISGWGQSGELAGRPGYDQVIQAATGMMTMQGDPGTPPMKVGFPAIDIATGMNTACAVLSALLQRHATGKGCRIDIGMADSALMLMAGQVANVLTGGQKAERFGNKALTTSPTAGVFETADGWISVAANTAEQGHKALDIVGRSGLKGDPRFAAAGGRGGFFVVADQDGATAAFAEALRAHDAGHWEVAFNASGIACGKLRTLDEYIAGPYRGTPGIHRAIADQSGYAHPVDALGAGFRVDGAVPAAETPAPKLGGDSAAVLAGLGYDAAAIAALARDKVVQLG